MEFFLSKTNQDLLYDLTRKKILNDLNFDIRNNFRPQMAHISQGVAKMVKKTNNMNNDQYLHLLDRSVLDTAVRLFIRSIQSADRTDRTDRVQEQIPFSTPPQTYNTNIEPLYTQQLNERNLVNQNQVTAPPQPNFEDPIIPNQPDPSVLYEIAEKNRQMTAIQPPPRMIPTDLNLTTQNILPTPATYSGSSGGNTGNYSTSLKDLPLEQFTDSGDSTERLERMILQQQAQMNVLMNTIKAKENEVKPEIPARVANNFFGQIAPEASQIHNVIPRSSRNIKTHSQKIPHILAIDSRDRNSDIYPNSNNYRVPLPLYKDIVSIELISAEIPNTEYNINSSNNQIYFDDSGSTVIATIPVGFYTITDLLTAISTEMTATGSQAYTATLDPLTNKITITAAAPWSFLFYGGVELYNTTNRSVYLPNSIGPIIGYNINDLTGATSYTGTKPYNLLGTSYILLCIPELENIETFDSHAASAFAKISMDVPRGEIKYYTAEEKLLIKYFSPKKGKLSNMTIKFKKYDGTLYDFNGQENSLTFRIITEDETQERN